MADIGSYDGGFESFPASPSTSARQRARVQLDDAIEEYSGGYVLELTTGLVHRKLGHLSTLILANPWAKVGSALDRGIRGELSDV